MEFSGDGAARAKALAAPMSQEEAQAIRQALGVTQPVLAEMLGLGPTARRTVWLWETGGTIPGTARIALRAFAWVLAPDFRFDPSRNPPE